MRSDLYRPLLGLRSELIRCIADLKSNTCTTLDTTKSPFSVEVIWDIIEAIEKNTSLTALKIGVVENLVDHLIHHLSSNTTLKYLDLSESEVTTRSALKLKRFIELRPHIVTYFPPNTFVTKVEQRRDEMERARLEREKLDTIAEEERKKREAEVKDASKHKCDYNDWYRPALSRDVLLDKCLDELRENGISTLDATRSYLSDDHTKLLIAALKGNTSLTALKIKVPEKLVMDLIQSLGSNSNLAHLDLSDSIMTSEFKLKLDEFVKARTCITIYCAPKIKPGERAVCSAMSEKFVIQSTRENSPFSNLVNEWENNRSLEKLDDFKKFSDTLKGLLKPEFAETFDADLAELEEKRNKLKAAELAALEEERNRLKAAELAAALEEERNRLIKAAELAAVQAAAEKVKLEELLKLRRIYIAKGAGIGMLTGLALLYTLRASTSYFREVVPSVGFVIASTLVGAMLGYLNSPTVSQEGLDRSVL